MLRTQDRHAGLTPFRNADLTVVKMALRAAVLAPPAELSIVSVRPTAERPPSSPASRSRRPATPCSSTHCFTEWPHSAQMTDGFESNSVARLDIHARRPGDKHEGRT